jgi:hypothetical protein
MALEFEARQVQYEKSSQDIQRDRNTEVQNMKKNADEELAKMQVMRLHKIFCLLDTKYYLWIDIDYINLKFCVCVPFGQRTFFVETNSDHTIGFQGRARLCFSKS